MHKSEISSGSQRGKRTGVLVLLRYQIHPHISRKPADTDQALNLIGMYKLTDHDRLSSLAVISCKFRLFQRISAISLQEISCLVLLHQLSVFFVITVKHRSRIILFLQSSKKVHRIRKLYGIAVIIKNIRLPGLSIPGVIHYQNSRRHLFINPCGSTNPFLGLPVVPRTSLVVPQNPP